MTHRPKKEVDEGPFVDMVEGAAAPKHDLDHVAGGLIAAAKGAQTEDARATGLEGKGT